MVIKHFHSLNTWKSVQSYVQQSVIISAKIVVSHFHNVKILKSLSFIRAIMFCVFYHSNTVNSPVDSLLSGRASMEGRLLFPKMVLGLLL